MIDASATTTTPQSNSVDIKLHRPFSGTREDILQLRSFLQALDAQFAAKSVHDDKRKIGFFSLNLLDEALDWYNSYLTDHPLDTLTYSSLVAAFKDKFGGRIQESDILKKLTHLSCQNGVDEYIREFDRYRMMLPKDYATDKIIRDLFLEGLRPYIRQCIRVQGPTTYYDAVKKASTIEHEDEIHAETMREASTIHQDTSAGTNTTTNNTTQPILSIQTTPRLSYHTIYPNQRNHRRQGKRFHRTNSGTDGRNPRGKYSRLLNKVRTLCKRFDLCNYCLEAGHQIANCPARPRKQ